MTTFNGYVDALRGFQATYGHTRVSAGYITDSTRGSLGETVSPVNLGYWVSYVRSRYRAGLLGEDRIKAINAAVPGFEWGPLKPGPRPGGTDNRDNEIRAYRQNGMSLQKIGERFNLTRQRIHQVVRQGTPDK